MSASSALPISCPRYRRSVMMSAERKPIETERRSRTESTKFSGSDEGLAFLFAPGFLPSTDIILEFEGDGQPFEIRSQKISERFENSWPEKESKAYERVLHTKCVEPLHTSASAIVAGRTCLCVRMITHRCRAARRGAAAQMQAETGGQTHLVTDDCKSIKLDAFRTRAAEFPLFDCVDHVPLERKEEREDNARHHLRRDAVRRGGMNFKFTQTGFYTVAAFRESGNVRVASQSRDANMLIDPNSIAVKVRERRAAFQCQAGLGTRPKALSEEIV